MGGRAEPYPDGSDWISLLWGPSVLAARGESLPTGVVLADRPHAPHTAVGPLTPLASAPIVTRTAVPYRDADGRLRVDSDRGPIPLEPFAGLHDARYTVTFPVASSADEDAVDRRRTALVERDRRAASIDGRTVDRVALGEQQPEADHGFEGRSSVSGAVGGIRWRSTAERLSVRLVDPHLLGRVVRVTWLHDQAGHGFTLEIDGTPIAPREVGRDDDLEWAEYPLTPTSAGWGVRRFALVAQPDRETPRCTELRVLTAEGA
ncbi:DUF6805 domain-containing protein [uncultured Plantibacter sp.]|uniref:DUF6805 domain-containing protein n=1 Tax=uncultured Plantibacter sp. TaxID=293337 RepID=UPI0028D70C4A|nr:DUF6805 domain-containing protein [uncultured Plantibacter sp.]